jgi:hypothetical protein
VHAGARFRERCRAFLRPFAPDGAQDDIPMNAVIGAGYLAISLGIGAAWGARASKPVARWLESGRPPTPEERRVALGQPFRFAAISGVFLDGCGRPLHGSEPRRFRLLAKQRPGRVLASGAVLRRARREEAAHWEVREHIVLRGRDRETGIAEPRREPLGTGERTPATLTPAAGT